MHKACPSGPFSEDKFPEEYYFLEKSKVMIIVIAIRSANYFSKRWLYLVSYWAFVDFLKSIFQFYFKNDQYILEVTKKTH